LIKMRTIVDVHTHVNLFPYNKDREEVIKRAVEAGIKMICVGIDAETSKSAVVLAEKYPKDIWATVGCHPHCAGEKGKFNTEIFRKLAEHPKVVAMGECGFDYFRNLSGKKDQENVFAEQIKLAGELKKPLMIHCRPSKGADDAYEDALNLISNFEFPSPKISHFYAGSLAMAKKLLNQGFYFTFGGVITFSRSYNEIIKFLPIENIMLETDAPYVAPEPYRGKRNEPVYIVEVLKKMAEIKNLEYDKILEITTQNAERIFNIK